MRAAAQWTIPPRSTEREEELARALGVPGLIAHLLIHRGYEDPEAAHQFLHPQMDALADPSLLPDYGAARDVLLGAKERGEKVFVHGDYDVDGVTSAAIFDRFLRIVGVDVHTHVPHRIKEGYGIHLDAVEAARKLGADVFLTCDCGVSAIEQVEAARQAGMKVVVTDHHTLGDQLPVADALINPHLPSSGYPFADLSGAGVVFRFCEGLARELKMPVAGYRRAFLELAALGTIADVMPLEGENRILARHGLNALPKSKKAGVQALLRVSGVLESSKGRITARDVGYRLGPRLNAAGRIDDAAVSLELLLTNDPAEAERLAKKIEGINTERKEAQQRIIDEARARVEERGVDDRYVIVVADSTWHAGVIGLVAGRLAEHFRRPTFVGTVDPETGSVKASARSIPGFHLADAIRAHPSLMSGGGHAMAAGFSCAADDLPAIEAALEAYARERLTAEDFRVVRRADAEVRPAEITPGLVGALQLLEPYGEANPEPVFVAPAMTLSKIAPTKSPEHVRLWLRGAEGPSVTAMGFWMGERFKGVLPGVRADVMFRPEQDEWQGQMSIKWMLRDFELL